MWLTGRNGMDTTKLVRLELKLGKPTLQNLACTSFPENLLGIWKVKAPDFWHEPSAYWGPINISRCPSKFSHPGDLAPWICAALFKIAIYLACLVSHWTELAPSGSSPPPIGSLMDPCPSSDILSYPELPIPLTPPPWWRRHLFSPICR